MDGVQSAFLRTLIDHVPAFLAYIDPDQCYRFANRRYTEWFGIPQDQIAGMTVRKVLGPRAYARARPHLEAALAGGPATFENWIEEPDGSPRYHEVRLIPDPDEAGTVRGLFVLVTDIDDYRRATDRLAEAEARWRSLVENADDIIVLLDREGIIQFINHTVEGFTIEETVGASVYDYVPFDHHEQFRQAFERVWRTGKPERMELRAAGPNRTVSWYESHFSPLRRGGEVVGVTVIANDITPRKQAEESLRRLNETLDLRVREQTEAIVRQAGLIFGVLNSMGDGVIVVDQDRRVLHWNAAATRILRLDLRDSSADEWFQQFEMYLADGKTHCTPQDRPLLRALRGEPVDATTHLIRHPQLSDGVWVSVTARPIPEGEKLPQGAVVVFQDITERRLAEEERERLEVQMLQTQKLESLGILAGGIAHDFNNILTAVLGNADLALMDLSPTSLVRESVDEIRRAAIRAADLCRQMLAYSGKGRFLVRVFSLAELVADMARLVEVSISKAVALHHEFEPDTPPIEADVNQIRQVVMNLITNASEAIGDRDGQITIRIGSATLDSQNLGEMLLGLDLAAGRYVVLAVADDGCGMDDQTRARIFDPFFTTKFTGRGLGMAAVLGIVRSHRGAIRVESQVGQGTRVTVVLPPTDKPAVSLEDGAAPPVDWRGDGTVLVVDDEEVVRSVARGMLEKQGFTVLLAKDGRQAVEVFLDRQSEIRAVLLDLTMPRMDGQATLRELQRIRPDVRVILSSGYDEHAIAGRLLGMAPRAFVQKPYRHSELLGALREVLAES